MGRLTAKDLLILEMLSDDCGHPLWELSQTLAWDKARNLSQKPPNIKNWVRSEEDKIKRNLDNKLKRLEKLGYIYTVERKYSTRWGTRTPRMSEYPYYINKNLDTLLQIQSDIAEPDDGIIWKYDKMGRIEQEKFDRLKWDCMKRNEEAPPTPDRLLKACGCLWPLIHLFFWCDVYVEIIRNACQKGLARGDFSLRIPLPPCRQCQESQRRLNRDQAHQNRMRLIWKDKDCLNEIKARRQYKIYSHKFENPVYQEIYPSDFPFQ